MSTHNGTDARDASLAPSSASARMAIKLRRAKKQREGYGTFGGVFVPTLLTLLGVIMYLRLGWVIGNADLGADAPG